jgi:prepilin peptidase CpaA
MSLIALPPQPIPPCLLLVVVIAASTDIVCRRIPNQIIGLGLVASLAIQAWVYGPVAGCGNWLAGAMTGFGLLIPLYFVRGMSAGDVKLLLMVGSWIGPTGTVYIALATFLIGGAWSLAFALWRGRLIQLITNMQTLAYGGLRIAQAYGSRRFGGGASAMPLPQIKSVGSLPYGVAIAAGTLSVLIASVA